MHESVQKYSVQFEQELRRVNHVTPKNYLDYLHTYRKELAVNRAKNDAQFTRLDKGLKRLVDAADTVESYGDELAKRKIEVDRKSKECQAYLAALSERQAEASKKEKLANETRQHLKEDNERIKYEAEQAEKALQEAQPALERAAEALKSLRREDISEIRVMPSPPIPVMAVCQCVLELKPSGKEDPSQGWKAVRVMMADSNFVKYLQTYKYNSISDKMMSRVKKCLSRCWLLVLNRCSL